MMLLFNELMFSFDSAFRFLFVEQLKKKKKKKTA